jgi:putative oxidoreductase
MRDLARLIIRLTIGGLVAGHGAQKLFGWFGGGGVQGTAGMMEKLEMRPSRAWALLAGVSEFGGGLLTLLGALNPLGPLGIIGAMSMATAKVHWGKPIWSTAGGAELPVTNMAAAAAIGLAGPGRYSLDQALEIRLPRWIAFIGLAGLVAAVVRGLQPELQRMQSSRRASGRQPMPVESASQMEARDQLEAAHTEAAQEAERSGSLM